MAAFDVSDYLFLRLDKSSALPRNRQLYQLLREAILGRSLPPDTRLPSSRDLARDLGISRNTVMYAYEQLLAEGYLESRSSSGTFVADTIRELIGLDAGAPGARLRGAAKIELSRRGQRLVEQAGAAPQQWGAFVPGVPDVSRFPHQVWSSLQNRVWRRPAPQSLTYGGGGGYQPLREALADHLRAARSVVCAPDQIVITSGIHQSIDLCLRLLSDPGDVVWVEDPCYWGARTLLAASSVEIVPIAVDAEGISPTHAQLARPPRFIFVTPSHQYPLGVVMSLSRRRMLLEYAQRHGCWIIEDDYDSEFRYGGRPLASLQGLDTGERVLYMGTFSKTTFPGLRLGYLVLPEPLTAAFVTGMEELYRSGQVLLQATMAEFILQGHFNAHIRRMRALYAVRKALLENAIRHHFGPDEVAITGSDTGLHLTLLLPSGSDDRAVTAAALAQGIAVRPLSRYYHNASRAIPGLVLGYACVEDDFIEPAFSLMAGAIRHTRQRS